MTELIPRDDLVIKDWSSRPRGGMHVARPDYGVEITHIPTGIVVRCEAKKSQHQNRAICIDAILGALTGGNLK